jgi:Histidine kinase/Y_Y_Y domain/Two component regulator propeller
VKYLLIILFFFSTLANGQSPLRLAFHHLTHEEGLSNNNAFYMYRDSRGFLWLGTLNGLTRFDGIHCKVYKENNSGLRGVKIFNTIEDKDGNLWVGSESGLNFYDRKRDAFLPIEWKKKGVSYTAMPYCVDNKGLVWVNIFEETGNCLYTYHPTSNTFVARTNKTSSHFVTQSSRSLKEVKTFYCAGPNDKGFYKITFKNNKEVKSELFFDGKNGLPILEHVGDYITVENDSTLWITGNPIGLIRHNPLKNTYKIFNSFENKTFPLFTRTVIYKNFLLICSTKGIYGFDKSKEKFVQHIGHSPSNLKGLMSNYVEIPYLDYDDNLFLSQLGPGIDYTNLNRSLSDQWLTSQEIEKLKLSHNNIGGINRRGSQTWLSLDNLLVLDSMGKVLYRFPYSQALFCDSQNRQWITDGHSITWMNPERNESKKFVFKELGKNQAWQIHLTEVGKNRYVISSINGLFEFDELANKITPFGEFNGTNRININPLLFDKTTNQVFVSANWWSSFFVLKKIAGQWKVIKNITNTAIYTIKPSADPSKIWLGTKNGLMKMDKQSFKYQLFTEKDGLPDNFVTDIVEEPTGNYWLVTGKGISYYDKQRNRYRAFNSKDGVYAKEYNWNAGFLLPDGRAVFGSKNGVTVMDLQLMKNYKVQPKIAFTQFHINEKPFKNSQNIDEESRMELQPNQNSFALDMVGIEFGFPQKVKIHYWLKGVDKQWIVVENPATARYANVPEGTYQFLAKATDEDGHVSSVTKVLTIKIKAPFYSTTGFKILLLLLFVSLGIMLYRLRISRVREEANKKEEIRRIRAESEIVALRSQMNPHFIFNCLNTIDSYVLLHKTDEASDFLNKFSRLIRMILENSQQEYIPLIHDLKALELYIKLEQERSYPKFKYEINIDESLYEIIYFIPSMIVQPFVENAILHGLRHKREEEGELFLNVKVSTSQIVINVIDNGIGREAAQKIKNFKPIEKQSVGLKLTEERIKKLNEIYEGKAYLKIIDIAQGVDKGTIVEIGLPLLTQSDLRP